MHRETFPSRKSVAQYQQHWEHFYWVGLLLRLLACLVVVCALLELLLRQGALQRVRVLLAVQAVVTAGVVAGALAGVVAMLWPSSLGDSSLYTDEQLKSLKEGRTRVRIHVEQQTDGSLKGYGYNTQKRTDWEMIPVVQFVEQGSQQVATSVMV